MEGKYGIFSILILILAVFSLWLFSKDFSQEKTNPPPAGSFQNDFVSSSGNADMESTTSAADVSLNNSGFSEPLERAAERVTKKTFGLYVTPKNSPVQPERFQGYHTGADFEIFPEETDIDVAVQAVCSGKLVQKESASGYGGVAIESCELEGNPITVIYGHLKLASIKGTVGSDLKVGDTIGILGKGFNIETDGERKHLHLGFHKGSGINILGYVSSAAQLADWIDPCLYVCGK